MKPEDNPITDDEWLLRRIRKELFPTQQDPVFSNEAFKPRYKGYDPDTDGISLFREACVDAPDDILAEVAPEKRPYNGIVRVSVAFVKSLGLSVQNKPEPPIKGHVIIQQFPARVFGSARFSCFIARRACGLGRRGDCGGGDCALVRIHAGRRCWARTATMGHPCPLLEVVRIRSSCSQLSAGNGRHLDQLKGEQHFVQMSDRFQTKAVKQVPHAFPKSTFAAQFVQHGLKQRIA